MVETQNKQQASNTDDVRIAAISELAPPANVLNAFPVSAAVAQRVTAAVRGFIGYCMALMTVWSW